ncbi:MAG: HIRAN domain-containing protein [Streptococcaceae bacterium]|nr:HIRAN domain-containing protein [Streptococcaceae bacterium]
MFTPSRHFMDFHLAGFTFWDGLDVLEELKHGTILHLVAEPDNPNDHNAVAIYYQEAKIGYVPRNKNERLAQFLFFGYGDIFETRINRLSLDHHPEGQIGVIIKIKDNRKKVKHTL